jgi:hypothetical protein
LRAAKEQQQIMGYEQSTEGDMVASLDAWCWLKQSNCQG